MDAGSKKAAEIKEKQWQDVSNPSAPSDERDKEQLLRQYKEAKRRKDNLTENKETK